MTDNARILVVDDDPDICALLQDYLGKNGFYTYTAGDCRAARETMRSQEIDLLVLDIMLPGEDGLVMCRELRVRSDIPIIMLTARTEETDRVVGLEMGADDYIPKPFAPRELLARIRAVLRRTGSEGSKQNGETVQFLFLGWSLDTGTRRLFSPEGVLVPLSGAEFRLLSVFLEHPNRVLTRDQIMDLLYGREAGPYDRAVDVQISRLRRRLGDTGHDPQIIKTVRSEGYLFGAEVKRSG